MSEQELQFHLWPDNTPKERHQKFKSTLTNLRLSLEPHVPPMQSSYVLQKCSGFYLTSNPHCWLDVEAFELEVCRARLETDLIEAISRYRQALRLYRGPFVIGLPETAVCLHKERVRLQQLYLEALEEVGLLFEKIGRCHDALWYYCLALNVDPDRVNARRLLYRLQQSDDDQQGRLVYSQWLVNALKSQLDAVVAPETSFVDDFEPGEFGYETA